MKISIPMKFWMSALLGICFSVNTAAQSYGPFKNTTGVSGNASVNNTALADISNTTFNFPAIGLGKTATTPVIQPDGSYNVTYTFTVKNYGNLPLSKIQVTDLLSAALPAPITYTVTALASTGTLKSITPLSAFTGTGAGTALLNAATSTLAVNGSGTITLKLNIKNNGSFGIFNNTARVTATTSDNTPVFDDSNNSAVPDGNGNGNPFDDATPTPITLDRPDIAVTKTVLPVTQSVGQNVSFIINVQNVGAGDAANVIVNDLLPDGFTFLSALPSIGTYDTGNGKWTIGILKQPTPPAL